MRVSQSVPPALAGGFCNNTHPLTQVVLTCLFISSCLLSSCSFYSTSISESNPKATPIPQPKSRLGVYVPQIPSMLNRTQSSEHFSARFSSRSKKVDVDNVLKILEDARKKMTQHLSNAKLNIDEVPVCVIIIHDSTGNFTSDTKQPWQVGAVTRGVSITMQPVDILRNRNSLESILRHEYVHVIVNALKQKQLPRWLNEGTALYYSGEGAGLVKTVKKINLSLEELEKKIQTPSSSDEMRQLYAAAFREVSAIIAKEGEAGLWLLIASK